MRRRPKTLTLLLICQGEKQSKKDKCQILIANVSEENDSYKFDHSKEKEALHMQWKHNSPNMDQTYETMKYFMNMLPADTHTHARTNSVVP